MNKTQLILPEGVTFDGFSMGLYWFTDRTRTKGTFCTRVCTQGAVNQAFMEMMEKFLVQR